MKIFSTFSGIGGFEIGIHNAVNGNKRKVQTEQTDDRFESYDQCDDVHESTFNCVGFSEIDKYAIKVYEKQFPGVKNYGDITKIKAKELKTLQEEQSYWKELSDLIPGWELYGWSYKQSVTYITPSHWNALDTDTIQMTGMQRDDLVKAITNGR